MQFSYPHSYPHSVCSGKTLDLGLSNWTMAAVGVALLSGGIIFGTCAGWWGQEVVRRGIFRLDDDGSQLWRLLERMQAAHIVGLLDRMCASSMPEWLRDSLDRARGAFSKAKGHDYMFSPLVKRVCRRGMVNSGCLLYYFADLC